MALSLKLKITFSHKKSDMRKKWHSRNFMQMDEKNPAELKSYLHRHTINKQIINMRTNRA